MFNLFKPVHKFLFFIILLFSVSKVNAQLDAKYFADLVDNNGVKIELWLVKPRVTCGLSARDWKFKLKTTNLSYRSSSQKFLTWKLKTINCEDYLIERVFSIDLDSIPQSDETFGNVDWIFSAKSIEGTVYDNRLQSFDNRAKDRNLGLYQTFFPPDSIIGNQKITRAQSITLKVAGKKLSGNADWYWYKNSCGTGMPVHKGAEFRVTPGITTTYFVRAEDGTKASDCKYVRVEIDDNSVTPSYIVSNDGDDKICQGNTKSKRLTVVGGRLGFQAQWVWYKDDIAPGNVVKRGEYIDVNPMSTTTYYVRAEGEANVTESVTFTLTVLTSSQPPVSLQLSPTTVFCEGQPVTLSIIGGKLGDGSEWIWNATTAMGNTYQAGEGERITDYPKLTTTYSVVGTSACYTTPAKNITVQVKRKSENPIQSEITIDPVRRKNGAGDIYKYKITNNGGRLGDNAQWVWSKDAGFSNKLATGPEYYSKSAKPSTIYLRAEGECNTTEEVSIYVDGIRNANGTSKSSKLKFGFISFGIAANNFDTSNVPNFFVALGSQSVYVKGTFSLPSLYGYQTTGISKPEFQHDGSQVTNYPSNSGTYYAFNGLYHSKMSAYTIGYMAGKRGTKLYMGAGYGSYKSLWGVDIFRYNTNQLERVAWAENPAKALNGPCFETGLFIKTGWVNLSAGISGIYSFDKSQYYTTGQFGIGLSF